MNAIDFIQVDKTFKNFAIKDFNLHIPQGYMTGLLGPNGSGKTTLIKLLMNILQTDKGQIKIHGESNDQPQLKQEIGFVYDTLYIYEELTIKKWHDMVKHIYTNWDEAYFQKLLQDFKLPYRKKFKHFSKGMKMKTQFLFALSYHPKLLILDEPTAGLDPIFRKKLLKILQDWLDDDQKTILFSTHITSDFDEIGDYFVLIDDGQIKQAFSHLDLQTDFHIVQGHRDLIDQDIEKLFTAIDYHDEQFTGLYIGDKNVFLSFDLVIKQAKIEDLMYFYSEEAG